VKAFDTTFAIPLRAGEVVGHKLDVLIAGDDEDGRARSPQSPATAGLNSIDAGPLKRESSRPPACFTSEFRTSSGPASNTRHDRRLTVGSPAARERWRMSEDPGVGQAFHGREGRAQARF
jgi:hypothetical protein